MNFVVCLYGNIQPGYQGELSDDAFDHPGTEISVVETEISVSGLTAFTYEHIKIFKKDIGARRDLGKRAHMKTRGPKKWR